MTRSFATKPIIRPLISPSPSRGNLRLVVDDESDCEQRVLALDFTAPMSKTSLHVVPEVSSIRRQTRVWDLTGHCDGDDLFDHQPTATGDLPSARSWSRTFGQALTEVLHGQRPVAQLGRWMTPRLTAYLRSSVTPPAARTGRRRQHRHVIARVRVDEPADGVAEVVAVIDSGRRSRSLSFRLEGWDGRWICTRAQLI